MSMLYRSWRARESRQRCSPSGSPVDFCIYVYVLVLYLNWIKSYPVQTRVCDIFIAFFSPYGCAIANKCVQTNNLSQTTGTLPPQVILHTAPMDNFSAGDGSLSHLLNWSDIRDICGL